MSIFDASVLSVDDHTGMHYTEILSLFHNKLKPSTYLEIGVEKGVTLSLSDCASIGIDPEFRINSDSLVGRKSALHLFQMTSDDFFHKYSPLSVLGSHLDMAFLDGMHHYEFLLRDFMNTERYCLPNSIIFLHDCLPVEIPMAEREFGVPPIREHRRGAWTGDVWKVGLILRKYRPDLRIISYDAAPTGLILVTQLSPMSTVLSANYTQIIEDMDSIKLSEFGLAKLYDVMEIQSYDDFDQQWNFSERSP